jgi:elongation factor Ts
MSTMAISAKDVAQLRARTGAGMMDCKKALEEAQGDMDKAVEILRKKGIAKAETRMERSASQGLVAIEASADGESAAMIELDCETDFVARTAEFVALARDLAKHAVQHAPIGVHAGSVLDDQQFRGTTVREAVKAFSGKTGEAMALKRVARFTEQGGIVAGYEHFTGQVGVLLQLEGPRGEPLAALAKEMMHHIASADPTPIGIVESDLPAETIARERRIAEDQVAQEGKPENIRGKIVEGKVKKFVNDRTLLGQTFVKDDKKTVGDLVKEGSKQVGAQVTAKGFARFKVGEG